MPHKPPKNIYVTICNHQAGSPLYMWLVSDLICKLEKVMVTYDTECPYWDQESLNNTNPIQPLSHPPSGVIKVSLLTHTYLLKPLRMIKVVICNYRADSPLYAWPNVYSGASLAKYCHTWHRMSLLRQGVIKQPKRNIVCSPDVFCSLEQYDHQAKFGNGMSKHFYWLMPWMIFLS